MSDEKKDELEGTEAPFVSHLVELRDRLIRAVIAIGGVQLDGVGRRQQVHDALALAGFKSAVALYPA